MKKAFILLNRIGDRALKIYNNFTYENPEDNINCKKILEKFDERFIPTKNVTYERHVFFTRNKKSNESFDEYVTELRQLANTCDFGQLTDSLIRDRLILGIQDKEIKDRLLKEKDLTLTKAAEICRIEETTAVQLTQIITKNEARTNQEMEDVNLTNRRMANVYKNQQPSTSQRWSKNEYQNQRPTSYNNHNNRTRWQRDETTNTNKLSIQKLIKNCSKCGSSHKINMCPAFRKICTTCNKPNHFSRCCRKNINVIEANAQEEVREMLDEMYINNVNVTNGNNRWYEKCMIQNKLVVNFRLDSGADCNILPLSYFTKLGHGYSKLNKPIGIVSSVTDEIIKPIGVCTLPICAIKDQNVVIMIEFNVVNINKPILGLNACLKLNLKELIQLNKHCQ
ncbi:hypothetical protein RI129_009641 [Pyrocoelia pectoralis]|uniref:Retropepsins domain-containing protein n=1 Tax=Pyrocoelia pectoralis TaxID=417401 RepID=A0AAN7V7M3_9COLE